MTVVEYLKYFRIFAVVAIICVLFFPSQATAIIAAIIFLLCVISYYIERTFSFGTSAQKRVEKIVTPLADMRIIVCSALIMLASLIWVPAWIVCILVGADFIIAELYFLWKKHGQLLPKSIIKEIGNIVEYIAIFFLLVHYSYAGIDFGRLGCLLLWIVIPLNIAFISACFFKIKNIS